MAEIITGIQQLFGDYYGRKSEESAQAYQEQKLESGLQGTRSTPQPGIVTDENGRRIEPPRDRLAGQQRSSAEDEVTDS